MSSQRAQWIGRALVMVAIVCASLTTASAHAAAQQPTIPPPFADLTRLADDVYVWRYQGYTTIFIVTSEGVIAADPIGQPNPQEPELYKSVIRSVTDQPVRYLLYSHGNPDHALGGDIFADTATLIGTQVASDKLAALNSARHPLPTMIVNDHVTLELGGVSVEIFWPGSVDGDDHLVLYYPARRILFAVDFIPVHRLLFRDLPGATSLESWMDGLSRIEANYEFDYLVPGHGPIGTKATVREVREYIQDLSAAVRTARSNGLADNSSEMTSSVRGELAPRYGTWDNFNQWLELNIAGVIRVWGSR